jgi:hypothetical protein
MNTGPGREPPTPRSDNMRNLLHDLTQEIRDHQDREAQRHNLHRERTAERQAYQHARAMLRDEQWTHRPSDDFPGCTE